MKVYFHMCLEGFSNCYVVVNDAPDVMEAIIIDPGQLTKQLVSQLEENRYKLTAVLVTHNHSNHVRGLRTLTKIYSPQIYTADYEIEGCRANLIRGEGKLSIAGLDVEYFSLSGHSTDSMVFKIGNMIFTGDTCLAGTMGETTGAYFRKLLSSNIEKKIFSQCDSFVLMPGHGPPSTVGAEKNYNMDTRVIS